MKIGSRDFFTMFSLICVRYPLMEVSQHSFDVIHIGSAFIVLFLAFFEQASIPAVSQIIRVTVASRAILHVP